MSRKLLSLALLAPLVAAAQPSTTPAARDPLDARAAVPPALHRSALAGYRGAASAPAEPIGWRRANDAVARIGGWRAYAREAAASEPAASAASAAGHKH